MNNRKKNTKERNGAIVFRRTVTTPTLRIEDVSSKGHGIPPGSLSGYFNSGRRNSLTMQSCLFSYIVLSSIYIIGDAHCFCRFRSFARLLILDKIRDSQHDGRRLYRRKEQEMAHHVYIHRYVGMH